MKTVITSSGDTINSIFDKRFGRAAWFCLYDNKTHDITFIQNNHVNDQGGVGTKVAEKMIESKVQKIISGDFGPKAKSLLEKFNIQMVVLQENVTISDIIEKLKTNH